MAENTHDVDQETVGAVGKVMEALETIERLTGQADLALGEGVAQLSQAGHTAWAQRSSSELIGLNVLPSCWTFQILEDYDDGYHRTFQELTRELRARLVGAADICTRSGALGDLRRVLTEADPLDKAEVCQQFGLRTTYYPGKQMVRAEISLDPNRWDYGLCPRPELTQNPAVTCATQLRLR